MAGVDALLGPRMELPGGHRQWIEDSMGWLVEQFGTGPLLRPTVLPSTFVPADYDGSEEAARALCLQVCARMEVPADRIRFSFRMAEVRIAARSLAARNLRTLIDQVLTEAADSEPPPGSEQAATVADTRRLAATTRLEASMPQAEIDALWQAGFGPEIGTMSDRELRLEVRRCQRILAEEDSDRRAELERQADAERGTLPGSGTNACWTTLRDPLPDHTAILLRPELLADPSAVIAAAAHELGHEVLDGGGLGDRTRPDREALVDLFGVFHGFGIFQTNLALERVREKRIFSSLGYLGERVFSEALAYYCLRRHQLDPAHPLVPEWCNEVDLTPRMRMRSRLLDWS
ncbi:hypothetical protein [Kribbella sp. CA-247076]|uniref:hypothetical protein n=1 Tax=Kribbella sp. CA-247076 TaxID=3239941 RepID=UPI003D8CAC30